MTTDKGTLVERADAALADGRLEQALGAYTALLEADARDGYAWYQAASILGRLGRDGAAGQLALAAIALAQSGELLLAIAAIKALEPLDQDAAAQAARRLGALYGRGSERLDRSRTAVPPPVPRRDEGGAGADLAGGDIKVLASAAEDACDKAAAAAGESKGPLPFHPLLSDLEPADLAALVPLARVRLLPAGERVIEQGAEGGSFFIVARGVVEVSREALHLARLSAGSFFGEMALLTRSPRTASVTSERPTTLLEFDREALEGLAGRNPGIARVLGEYTRKRLLRNVTATSALFAPLDHPRRESLLGLFASEVYSPGEMVVAEGKDAAALRLVVSGTVEVTKNADGETFTLAQMGPGQVFGEISLLQHKPATATVTALGRTVILSLSRQVFNQHVETYPEVLAHIYKLSEDRSQATVEAEQSTPELVDDELLI